MSAYFRRPNAPGEAGTGGALTLRRVTVLGIVACLAMCQTLLPFNSDRGIYWINQMAGVFPDRAFEQLVRNGQARPAPRDEVLHWVKLAKLQGNPDPGKSDLYFVAITYVIERGTQLPNGMTGSHSRIFLLRHSRELPRNAEANHNTYLLNDGTCIGPLAGCASL